MGNLLVYRLATDDDEDSSKKKTEGTPNGSQQPAQQAQQEQQTQTSDTGATANTGCKKTKKAEKPKEELKEQALPYGINSYITFLLSCMTVGLTSSVYYNWSGIERILVQQKVLQSLCTEKERLEALPGVFVCEAQRRDISNFCTYVTYTDVLVTGLAGPFADWYGAYIVTLTGLFLGICTVLLFYIYHESRVMLYVAFILWGVSGALVYAPAAHYHRMFPNATSIAYGILALFDNLSMAIPTFFYWIMEAYDMTYTDVLISYIFWGIIPSMLATLFFTPNKFVEMKNDGEDDKEENLKDQLLGPRYWLCLASYTVVFISAIYGRRAFSAYFYDDVSLNKFFALIQSFNFFPSPFIGILNQFIGVIPISIGIFFIHFFTFLTFYFPSYATGYLCLFLYNISSSVDIQQTMTYIGEYFPHNEATLMGIAQVFCAVVGYIVNIICDKVYYRYSPGWSVAIVLVLIVLTLLASFYVYYEYQEEDVFEEGQEAIARLMMSFFWFVPFYFSYAWLLIGDYLNGMGTSESKKMALEKNDYKMAQFVSTTLRTFGVCALFYGSTIFFVVYSVLKFCLKYGMNGRFLCLFLLLSFFVPGNLLSMGMVKGRVSIFPFLAAILMGMVGIYALVNLASFSIVMQFILFLALLVLFGIAFFILGNMLVYFNAVTLVKSPRFKGSLLQWGNMTATFILLFIVASSMETYFTRNPIVLPYTAFWLLTMLIFLAFSMVIVLYLPYNRASLGGDDSMEINGSVGKNNGSVWKNDQGRTLAIPKLRPHSMHYRDEYWIIYATFSSFFTLGLVLYENISFKRIACMFLAAFLVDLCYSILFCFERGQKLSCETHKNVVETAIFGSVFTLVFSCFFMMFPMDSFSALPNILSFTRIGFDTVIANSAWAIVENALYRMNGEGKEKRDSQSLAMVVYVFNISILAGFLVFTLYSTMSYDSILNKF